MKAIKGNILVLGDGDFSFSLKLLDTVSSDSCLTSTVLISEPEFLNIYGEAGQINMCSLKSRGANVFHSVDATDMPDFITKRTYDSIIFNFPHSGGKSDINRNRNLLQDMFKSFHAILTPLGSVHIALIPGQGGTPADGNRLRIKGNNWNIQDAAALSGFLLVKVEDFDTSNYNLSGYKSSSRAFFCKQGIYHIFKYSPYRSRSVRNLIHNPIDGSYLQMYLHENFYNSANVTLEIKGSMGSFSELVSIVASKNPDKGDMAKRIKLSSEGIEDKITECYHLTDLKSIFYPPGAIRTLYPTFVSHDVSFWTDSTEVPNIVPILLDNIGLAFHEVSHKEVYFKEETGKYAHNFRITYSNPFEAMSEDLIKSLAHITVRSALEKGGYGLH